MLQQETFSCKAAADKFSEDMLVQSNLLLVNPGRPTSQARLTSNAVVTFPVTCIYVVFLHFI